MAISLARATTALVRDHFHKPLTDNFFHKNFIMDLMWKNKVTVKGGKGVQWDLEVDENPNFGTYAEHAKFLSIARDKVNYANDIWTDYYLNVPISKKRKRQCTGPEAYVNYVKTEIKNAEKTMRKRITADLYGNGVEYEHNGRTVIPVKGIPYIVGTDRSYGGINSTTDTYWDGQVDDYSSTPTWANLIDESSDYYIRKVLAKMYNKVYRDGEKPTVIILSEALYEALMHVEGEKQAYQGVGGAKEITVQFEGINFRNNVRCVYDPDCPAGEGYMLNEEYIYFYVLEGAAMESPEFLDMGGDTIEGAFLLSCCVVISNCQRQGKMTGLPTSAY